MNKQNELGKRTEKSLCEFFATKKYWAHPLSKGINGQPVDVIAKRKRDDWFVDAKHLEDNKKSFHFSRIEPNQITSLKILKFIAEADAHLGFVIDWQNEFYFFDFNFYLELEKQGQKSVFMALLPKLKELVE